MVSNKFGNLTIYQNLIFDRLVNILAYLYSNYNELLYFSMKIAIFRFI